MKKEITCIKCKETKPSSEFYRSGKYIQTVCKLCKATRKRELYILNREYINKREKRYVKTAIAKKNRSLREAKAYKLDKEKWKTRAKTRYLVKIGVITKLNCEKCDNPKSEAHHSDYSKPLEVRWLCRRHHLQVHGRILDDLVILGSK